MMKKFLILFFITFLFSCDTSSFNSAYKDYYRYQQKYISAILDNDKNQQIRLLKRLIKCGEYLNFNVKDYKTKLDSLTSEVKTEPKKLFPSKKISKYVKIYSYNPLVLRVPDENIRFFTLNSKNAYKKVFDIHNAVISGFIKKDLGDIKLKMAQFNKKTVRVVLYSKNNFSADYKVKDNVLTISFHHPGKKKLYSVAQTLASKPKVFKENKKVIVIDPGHGGKDAGGVGIGRRMEKNAVLNIAYYLKKALEKKGYRVFLTRAGDYFIPLKKRTHFANLKKADLFISIHCNIAPKHIKKIKGIETYFLSPTRNERAIEVARLENKEIKGLNYLDQRVILNFLNRDRMIDSNKLAIDIQQGMLNSLRSEYKGVKDGGVRPAPFWVLVGTQMPAILIETGYLTNPLEAKRLFDPAYQKKLAKGIARGVENYFQKNP